jgi:glycosyltransferase involved in cell wall biosynthesis
MSESEVKVSVIATVKNESSSLRGLLDSLLAQTMRPDEVVIIDGGSTDDTVAILGAYVESGLPLRILVEPGCSISRGRNLAIAAARNSLVASTDAGVRLAPEWLEELTKPFREDNGNPARPDVACGFFVADAHSSFEQAMGATVLPDESEIDPKTFLPSSRSVAFTKEAWHKVGGYPEWLDYCEDLVFDLALRQAGCRFVFAPRAVVYFRPRGDLRSFFRQYYRYARGDGKADLWRKRHAVRYATYTLGPLAFLIGFWYKLVWLPLALAGGVYLFGPYRRLRRHLRKASARDRLSLLLLVPIIRFVGDVAKMAGYPVGLWWRWRRRKLRPSSRGESATTPAVLE